MIDGNKIRCHVISEQFATMFENEVEDFCKSKQIVDIKYTYAQGCHCALITYYIEN